MNITYISLIDIHNHRRRRLRNSPKVQDCLSSVICRLSIVACNSNVEPHGANQVFPPLWWSIQVKAKSQSQRQTELPSRGLR